MSYAPGGDDKLAVFSPKQGNWGLCMVTYTKNQNPVPQIRCTTCTSYTCSHCVDLKQEVNLCDISEDSPLLAFKNEFEMKPEMRTYKEVSAYTENIIPVYTTQSKLVGNIRLKCTYLCRILFQLLYFL